MNIIAEIGINHNGSVEIAKALIDCAVDAGFDYVKFQTRTPRMCVPKENWNKPRQTWWGEIPYIEYREKIELSDNDYAEIDDYCSKKLIRWFSSVWDFESAKRMKDIGCMIAKIASPTMPNYDLGKYCRDNFNTLIMSTGMSTQEEIDAAINAYEPDVIMHTNSSYPTKVKELNLSYINYLYSRFPQKKIGYSSHYYGLFDCFVAASMGVSWIEKHVTLNHDMWGVDQKSSVSPEGMKKLVKGIHDVQLAMGHGGPRKVFESEMEKRNMLRGK